MRTRSKSKQHEEPSGNENVVKGEDDSKSRKSTTALHYESGNLTNISREAVDRLLKRANPRKASGLKRKESHPYHGESKDTVEKRSMENNKKKGYAKLACNIAVAKSSGRDSAGPPCERKGEEESFECAEDTEEPDWEDGSLSISDFRDHPENLKREVTVEFDESPSSAKRKSIRRASVEEKELATLVHKVHLLCLLARGRLVDRACSDTLIQASLLSLLPSHLLTIGEVPKLSANVLAPLVNWFHNNFRVRNPSATIAQRSINSSLSSALETREGTTEEVVALSVALFRALNLTTRFVSILDVASLKPESIMSRCSNQGATMVDTGILSNSSTMTSVSFDHVSNISPVHSSPNKTKNEVIGPKTSQRVGCQIRESNLTFKTAQSDDLSVTGQLKERMLDSLASQACIDNLEACSTKYAEGSKRKGDIEYELQLGMALSATAVGTRGSSLCSDLKDLHSNSSEPSPPFKQMKKPKCEESPVSAKESSTAVVSRKVGPPLYWAEVYCSGETLTGRWVHVDAANAIIDDEQRVEASAVAYRKSLRYVVAFAGHGAKDVTRRYCMKWSKIALQRINSQWWDGVLAPLKELESGATGGLVPLEVNQKNDSAELDKVNALKASGSPGKGSSKTIKTFSTQEYLPDRVSLTEELATEVSEQLGINIDAESAIQNPGVVSRNSLEDMELETRALTEPLPTNQQAYRNHHLYAIERWLTKYQTLHPKGPILGFCSGHPVYPRTCVQMLHTKQRWLREGLQVKENEHPAKVVKRSQKLNKLQASEFGVSEEDDVEGTIALYGRWQLEPLQLPHAENGIVPKNERGQVDVWSEKCLPSGTVHLRFPRLLPVAKRLEIDFAPAMVGFEFRNGRSVPTYEGIVVCTEFKDAILEAYAEEEERREAEDKKRIEAQAISRWYQLLSSIVTRQRLKNTYEVGSSSRAHNQIYQTDNQCGTHITGCVEDGNDQSSICQKGFVKDPRSDSFSPAFAGDHEHVFPIESQSFDEESSVRTKRCPCGFSLRVEEL